MVMHMSFQLGTVFVTGISCVGCVFGIGNTLRTYWLRAEHLNLHAGLTYKGSSFDHTECLQEVKNEGISRYDCTLALRLFNRSDIPIDVAQIMFTSSAHDNHISANIYDFEVISGTSDKFSSGSTVTLPIRLSSRDFIFLKIPHNGAGIAFHNNLRSLEICTSTDKRFKVDVEAEMTFLYQKPTSSSK